MKHCNQFWKGIMGMTVCLLMMQGRANAQCFAGSHDDAATIMEVVGFKFRKASDGMVTFVPRCACATATADDPNCTTEHDCSTSELQMYKFFWTFGTCGANPVNYSTVAQPTLGFPSACLLTATMRATGIKHDDDPTDKKVISEIYSRDGMEFSTSRDSAIGKGIFYAGAPTTEFSARIYRDRTNVRVGDNLIVSLELVNPTNCTIYGSIVPSSTYLGAAQPITCLEVAAGECTPTQGVSGSWSFVLAPNTRRTQLFCTQPPVLDRFEEGAELVVDFELKNLDASGCGSQRLPKSIHVSATYDITQYIDPNGKKAISGTRYFPGERVTYAIKVENTGNTPENLLYIQDVLDHNFDGTGLQFIYLHVPGIGMVPEKPAGGTPPYFRNTSATPNEFDLEIKLNDDDTEGIGLDPKSTATLVFSVPIKCSGLEYKVSKPGELCDSTGYTTFRIDNAAKSMFSHQGRWYVKHSNPISVVVIKDAATKTGDCSWLCYMIIAILALILIVLLLYIMRMRSARTGSSARTS